MSKLTLQQEIKLLRSAVIGLVGEDKEGAYRPSFVKSTLATIGNRSGKRFVSEEQFLSDIAQA